MNSEIAATTSSRNPPTAAGFGLVAGGAALWGTDALFRRGLAVELPAPTVVFLEHIVLAVLTLPLLWVGRNELRRLSRGDWASALIIGAGSSTLATVAFTAAFRYGDPTTPLLLQKIQPMVAVIAARLILGERILPRFGWFLASGLAGAYLIAFADPTATSIAAIRPALLAALAAGLWGMGTVLGRRLSDPLSFRTLTALRFAIGLPAAGLIVAAVDAKSVTAVSGADWRAVVFLSLIPGLGALLLYYSGLRSTPASAATLAELAFPLSAATINFFAFGTTLTTSQVIGAVILAGTIAIMGWMSNQGVESIGLRSGSYRRTVLNEA